MTKLEITWRDFVPPVVFKIARYISEASEEAVVSLEVLTAVFIFAGLALGLLIFGVLPREAAALGHVLGSRGPTLRLNDRAQFAYEVYWELQKEGYVDPNGYVLGIEYVEEGSEEEWDEFDYEYEVEEGDVSLKEASYYSYEVL